MSKYIILFYGIFSYMVGLAGLMYFFLFVGAWDFLPFHIDSSTPSSIFSALIINTSLILLFGLQHSLMARSNFKERWIKVIPKASERSTYVLISGILMYAICFFWQALPGTVWNFENNLLRSILVGIHLSGWALTVLSSFNINHFELFGLQQVYFNFINKKEPSETFTDRFFYKIVRHPLQLGLIIGLWVGPTMSVTRLFLSTSMTIYILIGLFFEEKDLVRILGEKYKDYRKKVRMLIPFPK